MIPTSKRSKVRFHTKLDRTGLTGGSNRFKSDTYADANKELVEVDVTVTVGVEKSHNLVSLSAGDLELDLAESTVELFAVDLMVSIE